MSTFYQLFIQQILTEHIPATFLGVWRLVNADFCICKALFRVKKGRQ